MKYILILSLAMHAAMAQLVATRAASLAGTVVDAKTLKPVPAALVIANRAGAPPFTRNTRSGGDGAFQIPGLLPGNYSICVQATNDRYLDPCEWGTNATGISLIAGQASAGFLLKITAASVLTVQVSDGQKVLKQLTKDGRRPDLNVGVWAANGMYHPAKAGSPVAVTGSQSVTTYRLAVPRDTALNFYIASRDLKLGDAKGLALPTNASQQAFQHATGEANSKSFAFTVLGRLP